MNKIIVTFLALFQFSNSLCQVQVEWINSYPHSTTLKDWAMDHSGNLVITGKSTGNGNSLDIFTMKIDHSGNTLWQINYDSVFRDEEPAAISLDNADNIYISGDDYYRGLTFKYSSDGALDWKAYSGYQNFDNVCDSHSNIFVVGNDSDALVKKYDSTGLLTSLFGVEDSSVPYYIRLNKRGDTFIGGTELVQQNQYFFVEKYDSNEILQWHTSYFTSDTLPQYPRDMIIDDETNVYMVASAFIGTEEMYFAIKFDSSGNVAWVVYNGFGNTNDDSGRGIAVDQNRNVFLTGFSNSNNGPCYTVKYDSNKNLIWVDTIFNSFPSPNQKIALDKDGNVYILTSHINFDSVNVGGYPYEFLLKKLSNSGDSIWQVTYPASPFAGNLLFVDSLVDVYVSSGNSSGNGIVTIKYSQLTGINSISASVPSLHVFPNPFHSTTLLQLPVSNIPQQNFEMRIFDLPGKLIRSEGIPSVASYSITRGAIENGMYILKLYSENKLLGTTKIVIQ